MQYENSELLHRRYGIAQTGVFQGNAMVDNLLAHRSTRFYSDEPLPEGLLDTIIAAAQSAASSSNAQIWSVVAVRDGQVKSELARLSGDQRHIEQAPLFLIWSADFSIIQQQAEIEGVRLDHLDYLDAVLTGATNAAIAAQNAVVAIESLGLGAVYIGGLRNDLATVIRLLGLPRLAFPVFGLCVGYPDAERPAGVKPRFPRELVLHRERYRHADRSAPLSEYEAVLARFQQEHGLAPVSWSRQSVKRLQSATTLHGRERTSEVLKAQGFGLQ